MIYASRLLYHDLTYGAIRFVILNGIKIDSLLEIASMMIDEKGVEEQEMRS
jgi:hypothetical protein